MRPLHTEALTMIRKLLMFLGLRQAAKTSFMRRNGAYIAPMGGIIPALAWLAYQNRAKLMSMYRTRVAPKLSRGEGAMRTSQPYASAAI
jgi:hypothetical protein